MRHTITVAGGGSWGTALAHLLAVRGHRTRLWLRDAAVAEAINTRHENPRYLPGLALHPDLEAGTGPELLGTELLLLAIPCQQLRGWLHTMREHLHAEPRTLGTRAVRAVEGKQARRQLLNGYAAVVTGVVLGEGDISLLPQQVNGDEAIRQVGGRLH